MLGPNGEFYTVFLLYKLGDGYTKINTGFSGSNIPDERPAPKKDERDKDIKDVERESRKSPWTIQECNSTNPCRFITPPLLLLDVRV